MYYSNKKNWHSARKSFTLREVGVLLGKLDNAAEVYYLTRSLFANKRNSVIVSLRKNRTNMYKNKRFSEYIRHSQCTENDDI